MNIIIYGAGKAGQYLTRILTMEGHELTVIEPNSATCDKLKSLYDISIIESGGIRRDVFNEEIFDSCQLFIAVGPVDEMNIMACSVAKKVGADKTIARVRNEEFALMNNLVDMQSLGVDLVIHPEKELAKELLNLVLHPNAIDVYELFDGKILIVSMMITEDSPVIGKSLASISKIYDLSNMRAVIVEKGPNVIIPGGKYRVEAGDKVYVIAEKENVAAAFNVVGYKEETNKDIMINGCGAIAFTIAKALEETGKFNTRIIVNDETKADLFSELFSNSLVVHGEATEIDMLAAEGIIDMDFFLALTDNDETNIVSSLLANHLRVKKTVTLIEKTDYLPISKTIGLQRCINSSIATSNAIMRFVSHGNVLASSTLKGIDIDVITFKITAKNRYLEQSLQKIRFPGNSIVGVVLRDGRTFVPAGGNKIKPGDEIVIFVERTSAQEVEQMFAK